MNKALLSLVLIAAHAGGDTPQAEIRAIGLREAMRIAADGAVEVELARLALERSASDVAIARSDDALRVAGGSGLGATSGMPQSVQGANPSIAQLTVSKPLLDLQRPGKIRSAEEALRYGTAAAAGAAERAAYRAGILYLDFEHAVSETARLANEVGRFEQIETIIHARVVEGIELPLTLSRARLERAKARSRHVAAESRAELLEAELRHALGIGPNADLQPAGPSVAIAAALGAAAVAAPRALAKHPEVAALAANARAARNRASAAGAARYPKLDVVGQYALLARFNNYDDYFRRFQRHNWQVGVAVQIPILNGRQIAESVARARIEERESRLRQEAKQSELALASERANAAVRTAKQGSELARLELDFARENLDVLLARFREGAIALDELERGRLAESAAWRGMVSSEYALAKAHLSAVHAAGKIGASSAD